MDAQKVDMFIMANGKYFAEEKISFIRTKLLELDDSKWAQIQQPSIQESHCRPRLVHFPGSLRH